MMVICNGSVIIEYEKRRQGLPNAPLDVKYDNSSIEQSTVISLSMKHIFTYWHLLLHEPMLLSG